MNVRFLFFPRQSSGRTFPAGPGSGRRCCALLVAGSPRTLPAAAPHHSGPLAGVPVLLVAHQWAVVAQNLHGVLPVPARAAEILEADLWAEHKGHTGVSPAAKGHQQNHSSSSLPRLAAPTSSTLDPWAGENEYQRCCGGSVVPSFHLLNGFENQALDTGAAAELTTAPVTPMAFLPPANILTQLCGKLPEPSQPPLPAATRCQPKFPVPKPVPGACTPTPAHHGSQSSSLLSSQGHQYFPH